MMLTGPCSSEVGVGGCDSMSIQCLPSLVLCCLDRVCRAQRTRREHFGGDHGLQGIPEDCNRIAREKQVVLWCMYREPRFTRAPAKLTGRMLKNRDPAAVRAERRHPASPGG